MVDHTCILCLEESGLRYCAPCASTYLCRDCRARLDDMSYSAAAAGPELFNPRDFGDDDDAWADGAPPNWGAAVYDVPVASRGCCPNCQQQIPAEPLDLAVIDAFPEGLRPPVRAAAPVLPLLPLPPQPRLALFWHRGQRVLGMRVGTGNPAAGVQFVGTVAYFVLLPPTQRLVARFACNDEPDHSLLLDPGEWDPEHPSRLILFDADFAPLSRDERRTRVLRQLSLANVPDTT